MFPDYQRSIFEAYEEKMACNNLSPLLIHPTPANVRDACIEWVRAGIKPKDANILKGFFGGREDTAAYLHAIENCDIDKFRPLINFLKKPTINTAKINIELLACIIDYEPRPWTMGIRYPVRGSDVPGNGGSKTGTGELAEDGKSKPGIIFEEPAKPKNVNDQDRKKKERRRLIIITVCITAFCFCGYIIWNKNFSGKQSCMYWNIDHYEPVSCNKKMGTIPVLAFEPEKAEHFRKINRPDTITYNDIGKVWYTKSKTKYEFFTSDGIHPLNPNLELKRITAYIISKHILKDSLYMP